MEKEILKYNLNIWSYSSHHVEYMLSSMKKRKLVVQVVDGRRKTGPIQLLSNLTYQEGPELEGVGGNDIMELLQFSFSRENIQLFSWGVTII